MPSPMRTTKARRWKTALAALGLAASVGLATSGAAQAQVGSLSVEPEIQSGTLIMSWGGPVATPMAQQISAAFQQNKQRASRVMFKIASGGGSVAEGERVIEVLREIRQSHALETVVEQGRMCGSMCVFIYLQGQTRTAALSSLWLFHEVSHSDPVTKKIVRLDRPAWEQLVRRYYGPAGVSAEWTERMKPLTIDSDYWQTGADLIKDKSGIVHFSLGNQRERVIAGKPPKPEQPRVAELPKPQQPQAEPPSSRPPNAPRITEEPPGEPPSGRPSTPPRVTEKPGEPPAGEPPSTPKAAPQAPPKRVMVQYETKECRRLHPEYNIYVNVPCQTGAVNE